MPSDQPQWTNLPLAPRISPALPWRERYWAALWPWKPTWQDGSSRKDQKIKHMPAETHQRFGKLRVCHFSQVLKQQTEKKWKPTQETTESEKGFWINAAAKQTLGASCSTRDWSLVLTYSSDFYIYQWTACSFLRKVSVRYSEPNPVHYIHSGYFTGQIPRSGGRSLPRSKITWPGAKSWEASTPFLLGLHYKLQTSYKYTCCV